MIKQERAVCFFCKRKRAKDLLIMAEKKEVIFNKYLCKDYITCLNNRIILIRNKKIKK